MQNQSKTKPSFNQEIDPQLIQGYLWEHMFGTFVQFH